MAPSEARYLVLSDMHFGTPESSVNDPRYLGALVDRMVSRAPWEEIVLTGDLLDVNLSTLTRALEGGPHPGLKAPLFGFRHFVETLDSRMKEAGKGLADLAARWVYVPGNHDYKIWDMLSSKVVCDDVLAAGDPLGTVPTPLMTYRWTGPSSFFAGVFRRAGVAAGVTVSYPNHEVSFGERGTLVLTHGHYLDASQTRGNDLAANLRGVTDPARVQDIVRRIFIETAQYQAVANAVSFTQGTRRIVDELFGPDGIGNKVRKIVTRIGGWILGLLVSRKAALRGQELSPHHLENIDYYVDRFCACDPRPTWFVFGHTHRQGLGETPGRIQVFNVGSCYPDGDRPITFLEIDVAASAPPVFQLMCVDRSATARRSSG
jgi:UDP-2,3-diacylglucosamine pyrophosphatase LpxH